MLNYVDLHVKLCYLENLGFFSYYGEQAPFENGYLNGKPGGARFFCCQALTSTVLVQSDTDIGWVISKRDEMETASGACVIVYGPCVFQAIIRK